MQKWGLKERYNTKYRKGASNSEGHSMKHEEMAKIRPFLDLKIVLKWKHNRLPSHAKMGTKDGYKDKWYMEVPNSDEPFFYVEEGLKISLLTDYIMLQNRSHIG